MSLLKGLKKQLRDLQSPRTLHDLHNLAGAAVHDLVMQGFDRSADPYGVPWQPTKQKNRILVDTSALKSGIQWKADRRGLVIRTTGKANKYAVYHQGGTQGRARAVNRRGRFRSDRSTQRLKTKVAIRFVPGLPARQFLPDEGRLPPAYETRIRNDFRTYFRQRYGGR